MEKPVTASEFPYLDSVIFVFHHIHSPLGRLENPVSYLYKWISFSQLVVESETLAPLWLLLLLLFIAIYFLFWLKMIFMIHTVGTGYCIYIVNLKKTALLVNNCWIVWYEHNFTCTGTFLTYVCISNPTRFCHNKIYRG